MGDASTLSWPLRAIVQPLRSWIRWVQSDRESIGAVEKVVRASLMVPAFSLLLALLRLRIRVRGPFEILVTARTGDRFLCHPPDFIQLYLWLFDVWEPDLTRFLQERLRAGDGFIDVGANIGVFSALAARCVGPTGSVVAIEASPEVFGALQDTMKLNPHCRNVRCVNKAAAASAGTITLFRGPDKNTGLTTTMQSRGFQASGVVETLPLDDLLSPEEIRGARIVKIDVEGAEERVIAGMRTLLAHCRKDAEILIELSPHWWPDPKPLPTDVLRPLFDAGFHAYAMDNNYWPWRYMWPRCVDRPRRYNHDLNAHIDRLDLVMSRRDVEFL